MVSQAQSRSTTSPHRSSEFKERGPFGSTIHKAVLAGLFGVKFGAHGLSHGSPQRWSADRADNRPPS